MKNLKGSLLTPQGWIEGDIEFGVEITAIRGAPIAAPGSKIIIPGFVDLHIHGGQGYDMMQGEDAIRRAAEFHARCGTTSMLATSVTAPKEEISAFMKAVKNVAEENDNSRARILGAHLEGPFVNPNKLGAQPPYAIVADLDLVKQWMLEGPLRVMTVAPEMDENHAVIKALDESGVKVQIGHSLCTYAEATELLNSGIGVTHLFNAMSGFAHRQNGISGAAIAHAEYAEIIPDLVHVEAGAILAARRAIPKLYGVTDSTAGAGMPDGNFRLGAYEVTKFGDRITLEDGTLAGSILTMDQAFRNLVKIGLPIQEASQRLSAFPAQWIGDKKIGELRVGAYADMLVMDKNLAIKQCYIGGELL